LKKILTVIGTRPNFIKVTQFNKYLNDAKAGIEHKIVHTGQHYDDKMSKIFFEQFGILPDFWLNVERDSANGQVAKIMIALEKVISEYLPDLLIVVGDVNSTLAAALTANKMGIQLVHVESGLRSNDRTMPEEINRLLTDELSDHCFVTEQSGLDNLIKEGKADDQIHFVGNTMIDALVAFNKQIMASNITEQLKIDKVPFALMTMHRPATVDSREGLEKLLEVIKLITAKMKLVFPIHPRTLMNFEKFDLKSDYENISGLVFTQPLDYFAFQKLVANCSYVITDSGGIQEETTFRQVPCITLRSNTERPVTCSIGTNTLASFNLDEIAGLLTLIETGNYKKGVIPQLWDGNATSRLSKTIINLLHKA
jgi:UDP-N-acetylglucosamine 2-epimerase (non-hydrolysing)